MKEVEHEHVKIGKFSKKVIAGRFISLTHIHKIKDYYMQKNAKMQKKNDRNFRSISPSSNVLSMVTVGTH